MSPRVRNRWLNAGIALGGLVIALSVAGDPAWPVLYVLLATLCACFWADRLIREW